MARKYITRCVVKRNGKTYKKGSFIEDLTAEEIKQGLAQNWLMPVGEVDEGSEGEGNEGSGDDKTADAGKSLDRMNKEELLTLATELSIETAEEMKKSELVALIKEKQAV